MVTAEMKASAKLVTALLVVGGAHSLPTGSATVGKGKQALGWPGLEGASPFGQTKSSASTPSRTAAAAKADDYKPPPAAEARRLDENSTAVPDPAGAASSLFDELARHYAPGARRDLSVSPPAPAHTAAAAHLSPPPPHATRPGPRPDRAARPALAQKPRGA